MTREETLNSLQEKFRGDILHVFDKSPKRVYVDIKPEALTAVATYAFKDLKARFNIASGVDCRSHMEILYHFTVEDLDLVISFRVKLDRSKLEIASLISLFKAVDWIEREIHEMLGINFIGHPDLKRLLLPDEWPDGVYPLRRDYKEWDETAIRDRGV